jgi:hypothetical protein
VIATSPETDSFPAWLFVLVGAIIAASWIRYVFIIRQRMQEMRAMATRLGLQEWPDDSTPRDLSLNGTVFERWSKLFNVYEGILSHWQVAVFDFRERAGKSSWSRTIIAVKTNDDVFEGKAFGLETRQAGDWQLCYPPKDFLSSRKLMDVTEIEEFLNGISRYKAT